MGESGVTIPGTELGSTIEVPQSKEIGVEQAIFDAINGYDKELRAINKKVVYLFPCLSKATKHILNK
jgi:hypothetical protein